MCKIINDKLPPEQTEVAAKAFWNRNSVCNEKIVFICERGLARTA